MFTSHFSKISVNYIEAVQTKLHPKGVFNEDSVPNLQ